MIVAAIVINLVTWAFLFIYVAVKLEAIEMEGEYCTSLLKSVLDEVRTVQRSLDG